MNLRLSKLLMMATLSVGGTYAARSSAAPSVPQAVSLGGELFLPDGSPVVSNRVNFRIQVYDAAQSCVLYSENQLAQNLSRTNGRFNLVLGSGSGIINNVGTPGVMDATVFANPGIVPVANCASPSVALSAGSARMIRISYDLGSGYVALSPDVPLVSSAYAMVADSLAGKGANDFIQVADNGSTSLNQANTEYTFSSINWPRLKALLDGNSGQYLPTTPTAPLNFNGQRLTAVQDPVNLQDVVTKNYADTMVGGHSVDLSSIGPMTGNNNTLLWDATANRWVAGAVNTSPTGAAGGDLTGTYPNPTIANDTITAAKIKASGGGPNRLLITDPTTGATIGYGACAINEVYAWTATGWACTTVTSLSPVTSVAGRGGDVVLTAGDIGGLGTAALYNHGTAANQILRLDGSARIPAVDGLLLTNLNAVRLQSRDVANIAPTPGQLLGWNGTAWVPVTGAAGSVTNVSTGVGLNGGPITTAGTISVDVGTGALKILQLDGSARIPAVDASLLYNVKLAGRDVATTAPIAGTFLGWNTTSNQWEPVVAATGSVQSVGTGNGLLGGTITTNGTLSVDTGTTANKILQLNASARIPAVDASLLYNVNATKLATRTISSAAPGFGQVLGFNVTTTQWEPVTASTGSVQSVNSGIGLLGGPVTTNGTLNVDVGTTASKILQLNSSAQIPAVDGSLLFNVKIGTRSVATTVPNANQVLGWNSVTTQWEPQAGNANSVTNVATGNGIVGGPITSTGTISVDSGTTANKILQLNSSAQIPAVDASLLYNVNASRIATRTVSMAAPGAGQVLGWNVISTQWEPVTASTGSVQSVSSGVGLTGGPITVNGTLNVDVGTTANKIVQLNSGSQLPAVDGSLLTNVNASRIATRPISTTAPTTGQVLAWNALASQWTPATDGGGTLTNLGTGNGILGGPITSTGTISIDSGTTANKILQLNSSAQIPAVDASLLFNVNASKIATRTVAATSPTVGQVLGWNVTATQWEPVTAATGSVQSVSSGVGLTGGPITTNGTLNVDVGTSANKILQLNTSAMIPAVDGSLLSNVNASRIAARTVSAAAPSAGQVLAWNATASAWTPATDGGGTVTNITTGNGILGGPINSAGTIVIDSGTTASKILQLNGSAQIPAVDASLLFNVNASRIATRTVASIAPTAGQVLGWNLTANQWEPVSAATGSVQSVASGLGLTGGPITTNGTLNVDVGTTANKILQLDPSGQIPAVDASLLANVNAVRLQTRAISASAPTSGQVLAWNSTTNVWEPRTSAATGVTSITAGTGLLGGVITSTGTVAVDVGATANKIVQENANAQIAQNLGSVGAPSYSFVGNTNTGLFSIGANHLNLATNGSTGLLVAPTGYVAIGSVAPSNKFEVQNGNLSVRPENATGGARLGVGASGTELKLQGLGFHHYSLQNTNGTLKIGTTDSNNDVGGMVTPQIQIDSSGNVGINTTSAGSTLDVNGVLRTTQICDRAGANCLTPAQMTAASADTLATVTGRGATTTTASSFNGGLTASALTVGTNVTFSTANPTLSAPSYLLIPNGAFFNGGTVYVANQIQARGGVGTDTNAALTINGGTSGYTYFPNNVGLGATAPSAKMEIVNSAAQPALSIGDGATDNGASYGMLNLTRPADTTRAHLAYVRAGQSVWQTGYVNNTNTLGFFPGNFSGSQGTPTMSWSSGAVGINKAAPGHALDVVGNIVSTSDIYSGTAGGWLSTLLANKQPLLGYTPVNRAGDTLTGRLNLSPAGLGIAQRDDITTRVDSGFYQTNNAQTATGWPVTTNSWYHLLSTTHSNDGNYYAMQFAGDFFSSDNLYYRATNGGGSSAWNRVITSNASTTTIPNSLTFAQANPSIISGGSYITIPNGLYVSGGTPYFQGQIQARGGIHNDSAPYLQVDGGTAGRTYFSGSVGIGTASPATQLEVAGTVRASQLQLGSGLTYADEEGFKFNSSSAGLTYDGEDVYVTSEDDIELNATNRVSVTGSRIRLFGNVAINTTSPTAKLDVAQPNFGDAAIHASFGGSPYWRIVTPASGAGVNWNGSAAVQYVGRDLGTNRSINAAGTVNANGADFAEWVDWEGVKPEMGAIVEYRGSYVVVSSPFTAAFVGNDVKDRAHAILVAFAGQLPVLVVGQVRQGDLIVANDDGTGRAISRQDLSMSEAARVVGTAWEASDDARVKRVNVAVGIGMNGHGWKDFRTLERKLEATEKTNATQAAELTELKARLDRIEKLLRLPRAK